MNTFLPYPEFQKSAQCLDCKRLGKQRVETWQIYNTLKQGKYKPCKCGCSEVFNEHCVGCSEQVKKTPWYNHPIVKMWEGYKQCLLQYGIAICNEWIKRGYKDTLLTRFEQAFIESGFLQQTHSIKSPNWLGNKEFHASHRSNLLRKNKDWYSLFGWKESDNLPYIWFK
jgi:hypothetical protein